MESKGTGAEIKAAPAAPRLAISGTGSGKNASKTSKSKSKSTKQYAESIAEYHAIACVGPREHDFFSKEFNAEAVLCENVRVPVPVPSAKLFDNVGMAKRIAESPLEQAARRVPVATPKPGISRGHVCLPRRAMHQLQHSLLQIWPSCLRSSVRRRRRRCTSRRRLWRRS